MRDINMNITGLSIGHHTARAMANSLARMVDKEPIIMAWHDRPASAMAPEIAGADVHTRWRDYGESFGGDLLVTVNGDYDFIFADSERFETDETAERPYVNVRDAFGNEYLCHRGATSLDDEECAPIGPDAESYAGG
jgi:hypothetical protein